MILEDSYTVIYNLLIFFHPLVLKLPESGFIFPVRLSLLVIFKLSNGRKNRYTLLVYLFIYIFVFIYFKYNCIMEIITENNDE